MEKDLHYIVNKVVKLMHEKNVTFIGSIGISNDTKEGVDLMLNVGVPHNVHKLWIKPSFILGYEDYNLCHTYVEIMEDYSNVNNEEYLKNTKVALLDAIDKLESDEEFLTDEGTFTPVYYNPEDKEEEINLDHISQETKDYVKKIWDKL